MKVLVTRLVLGAVEEHFRCQPKIFRLKIFSEDKKILGYWNFSFYMLKSTGKFKLDVKIGC